MHLGKSYIRAAFQKKWCRARYKLWKSRKHLCRSRKRVEIHHIPIYGTKFLTATQNFTRPPTSRYISSIIKLSVWNETSKYAAKFILDTILTLSAVNNIFCLNLNISRPHRFYFVLLILFSIYFDYTMVRITTLDNDCTLIPFIFLNKVWWAFLALKWHLKYCS